MFIKLKNGEDITTYNCEEAPGRTAHNVSVWGQDGRKSVVVGMSDGTEETFGEINWGDYCQLYCCPRLPPVRSKDYVLDLTTELYVARTAYMDSTEIVRNTFPEMVFYEPRTICIEPRVCLDTIVD